jgi:hypothetical protein
MEHSFFTLGIAAIAIVITYFIFQWFMQPTRKLLQEQNRLLKKLVNEPEPVLTSSENKTGAGTEWAIALTVITIIAAVFAFHLIK